LRERREDIPPLATHFLQKFSKKYNKDIKEFSAEALNLLSTHPFQGNVRELERLIESVLIFKKEGGMIEASDVKKGLGGEKDRETSLAGVVPATTAKGETEVLSLKELEKQAIEQALKACNYNKARASQLLGLSRDRLYRKIKAYGIMR
ncbi:MAG: helix-turn-helix domain-containing protein, partial [Candidatus Brocadiales bacterium]